MPNIFALLLRGWWASSEEDFFGEGGFKSSMSRKGGVYTTHSQGRCCDEHLIITKKRYPTWRDESTTLGIPEDTTGQPQRSAIYLGITIQTKGFLFFMLVFLVSFTETHISDNNASGCGINFTVLNSMAGEPSQMGFLVRGHLHLGWSSQFS